MSEGKAADRAAIIVRVETVLGSAPREPGASMLVTEERLSGTIGGGALEWKAIALAREMLATGEREREVDLPLGPLLEQCCGGQVRLSLRRVDEAPYQAWREAQKRRVLPTLHLYGAGHVGRAVAHMVSPLPCRIRWFDARPELQGASTIEALEIEPLGDPGRTVSTAPPDAFHLVMTHSHPLDYAIVDAVLRQRFAWLGLIGSKSKRRSFEHRLLRAGIPRTLVERLVCPIGMAGIRGKEPAVIAVSTAAQLMLAFEAWQQHRERTGGAKT